MGGVFLGQAGGPVLGVARLGGPLGLTAWSTSAGWAWPAWRKPPSSRARRPRARAFARVEPDGALGRRAVRRATGSAVPAGAPPWPAPWRTTAARSSSVPSPWPSWWPSGRGRPRPRRRPGDGHGHGRRRPGGRRPRLLQVADRPGRGAGRAVRGHPADRTGATGGGARARAVARGRGVPRHAPVAASPVERRAGRPGPPLHTTLVVGVTETVSPQRFRNEIVAFGPDGTIVARYEKVHRVPFGEYVPLPGLLLPPGRPVGRPARRRPRHTATGLLPTPAGPLGAMVSYEVFYAGARPARPCGPGPSCSSSPPTPRPTPRARCRPRRSPPRRSRPSSRAATCCRPPRPGTARPSPIAARCSSVRSSAPARWSWPPSTGAPARRSTCATGTCRCSCWPSGATLAGWLLASRRRRTAVGAARRRHS